MLSGVVLQRQKLLATSIVLSSAGMGPGGLGVRDMCSTAELLSWALQLLRFKLKHGLSVDV